MLFAFLRALGLVRVTVAYGAVLTAVTTALTVLGPRVQERVVSHASTNLHNLSHGHIGTLVASAIVVDAGPIYIWLPGLMCLLALAELMWGGARLSAAFAGGHVGATLLVAAGLSATVELGWLSADVTRATDVGMSYGAVAVLGALTAAIPLRWRPAWVGWWLVIALVVAAVGRDFTDAGHAVALVLGMAVSTRFGPPAPWNPLRRVMLAVAGAFGFLMLANTGLPPGAAVGLGLLGAVTAEAAVGRRLSRRRRPQPSAESELALTPGVA